MTIYQECMTVLQVSVKRLRHVIQPVCVIIVLVLTPPPPMNDYGLGTDGRVLGGWGGGVKYLEGRVYGSIKSPPKMVPILTTPAPSGTL